MKYHIQKRLVIKLKKLEKRNRGLIKQISKQLSLFEDNERHPSLRNHKLKGDLGDIWSISVGMGYRMVYFLEDDEAYFFDCGTHNEVYKSN
jgi:addiction module RelE/StbE family toxin